MFKTLLGITLASLSIWKHKNATKYTRLVIELKDEFYEEYNKPENERSDAILDNLMHKLRIFSQGIASEIGTPNS